MHILRVLKWKIKRGFPWRIVNANKEATMKGALARELNVAFIGFDAPIDLLATVGSYGDTLPDDEILDLLKDFNETGSIFTKVICDVSGAPENRRVRLKIVE